MQGDLQGSRGNFAGHSALTCTERAGSSRTRLRSWSGWTLTWRATTTHTRSFGPCHFDPAALCLAAAWPDFREQPSFCSRCPGGLGCLDLTRTRPRSGGARAQVFEDNFAIELHFDHIPDAGLAGAGEELGPLRKVCSLATP